MNGNYYIDKFVSRPLVLDTRDSYVDSFTEFFPFCRELYFFSTFKDFCNSFIA
jgi:hypothetical protein